LAAWALLGAVAMAFIAPLVPAAAHAAAAAVTVQGTVLDKSTSQPVAASVVVIKGGTGADAQVVGFGESDAGTGAYSIGGVPDGAGYRVRATLDGYAAALSDPFDVTDSGAPPAIELQLAPYETVVIDSDGDGTVSPAGPLTVPWGQSVALTLTPAAHHHVATLTDNGQDGLGQLSGTQYTIASILGAHQIQVGFAIDTNRVTPSVVGSGGTITPAAAQDVPWGGSQTFRIAADDGTPPLSFEVDGEDGTAQLHADGHGAYSYTFSDVTASHSMQVTFHRTIRLDSSDVADGATVKIAADGSDAFKVTGLTTCPFGADQTACSGLPKGGLSVLVASDFPAKASLAVDGGKAPGEGIRPTALDIELDGVTMTGGAKPPIALKNGENVVLTLNGANTVTASDGVAGIEVPAGNKLVVKSASGGAGMLNVSGGSSAAGIGGDRDAPDGGEIQLTSGLVEAEGGSGAAGIGGGFGGAAGDITIEPDAFVVAAAGIGASVQANDVGAGGNAPGDKAPGQSGNRVIVAGGSLYGASNSYLRPVGPSGQTLAPLFVPAGVPSGARISGGSPELVGSAAAITDGQAAFLGGIFPSDRIAAVMWQPTGTYGSIEVAGTGSYSAIVGSGYPSPMDSGSDNWLLIGPAEIDASAVNGSDVDKGYGVVGEISPAGAVTARDGADVTFKFGAHEDFTVSSVIVDGTAVTPLPRDHYTFSGVHGHHTIEVVFGQRPTLVLTDQIVPDGLVTIEYTGSTTVSVKGVACPAGFGDCTGLAVNDLAIQLDHLRTTRVVVDGGLGEAPTIARTGVVAIVVFGMDVQPADGAPLEVTGGANVTLYFLGQNRLVNAAASTSGAAGLEVDHGSTVAIVGVMAGTTLQASGAAGGAGIGGGTGEAAGRITFRLGQDFGTVLSVWAVGGAGGAGIGGGYGGGAGDVFIGPGTIVAATAGGTIDAGVQGGAVPMVRDSVGAPAQDLGAGADYDETAAAGTVGNRLVVTGGTVFGTHMEPALLLQPVNASGQRLYPVWVPASLQGGVTLSGGGLPAGLVWTTMTADQAQFFADTGFPVTEAASAPWALPGDYHGITTGSGAAAKSYDLHVSAELVTVHDPTSSNWLLVDPNVVTLSVSPGGSVTPSRGAVLQGGNGAQTNIAVRGGADQGFQIEPADGAWVAEVNVDGQPVDLADGQAGGFTYTLADVTSAHTVRVVFGFAVTVNRVSLGSSKQIRLAPDTADTFSISGLAQCPAVAGDCTGLPTAYVDVVLDGSGTAPVPSDLTVLLDGTMAGGMRNGSGHLTLKSVTLTGPSQSPIELMNGVSVSLALVGKNTVTARGSGHAAIMVSGTSSLEIKGTDTLAPTARAGTAWGSLTATGAAAAAGIGGEAGAQVGSIAIVSGEVRAVGGTTGAGIGGGGGGSASSVQISGGTVVAKGGSGAAGIGGGFGGAAGDIVIGGTATEVVARGGSTSGQDKPYDIGQGGGYAGFLVPGAAGDSVVIEGGAVFAPNSVMAPTTADQTPVYPVYVAAGALAGELVNVPTLARGRLAQTPSSDDLAWFGADFPADVLAMEAWAPKGGYSGVMIAATGPFSVNVPATTPVYTVPSTDHWLTDASDFTITARATADAGGDAHGAVTPSGVVRVRAGADQAIGFIPDAGYRIGSVTVDGQAVPVVGTYDFENVVADHTVDVAFVAVDPSAVWRIGAANVSDGHTITLTYTGDGTMTLTGVASCPLSGCTGLETASTRLILGSDLPADTTLALDGQMPDAASDGSRATPIAIGLADGLNLSSTAGSPIRLANGANLELNVGGDVRIATADGVSAVAGVLVPAGNTLSVVSTSSAGATLTVSGAADGAGIGGGAGQEAGAITLNGVQVTATGGAGGAGIGGGQGAAGGAVRIAGGRVTATGGAGGAGIGGGQHGAGGSTRISGGRVAAVGGLRAAGIGGGEDASGGDITVTGGAVKATGGSGGGAGIGGGYSGGTGSVALTGGAAVASGGDGADDVGPGLICRGTECAGTVRLGAVSLAAAHGLVQAPTLDESAIGSSENAPGVGTAVYPLFVPGSVGRKQDVRPGGGLGVWSTPDAADVAFLGAPYGQTVAAVPWVPAGTYAQATVGGTAGYRATVTAAIPLVSADTSDNWLLNSGTAVTVAVQGNGQVSPNGTVWVRPGASLTLTLTPGAGQWVTDVTLDGHAVSRSDWLGGLYTMTAVQAGVHHVAVKFGGAGSTIAVSDQDVADGVLTLKFQSDATYQVTGGAQDRSGLSVASDVVKLDQLAGTAVVIDGAKTGGATRPTPLHVELASLRLSASAPIKLVNGANVVFELDGSSSVTASTQGHAAVEAPAGTIAVFEDLAGSDAGVLLATGGSGAAAIGGATGSAGQIMLAGGTVRATGGAGAAAIGGARGGAGGDVWVLGDAFVAAVPGSDAAYAVGSGQGYLGTPGAAGNSVRITGGTLYSTGRIMAATNRAGEAVWPVYVPAAAGQGNSLGNGLGGTLPAGFEAHTITAAQAAALGTAFPGALAAQPWLPAGEYAGIAVGGAGSWWAHIEANPASFLAEGATNWLVDDAGTHVVTTSVAGGDGTVNPAGIIKLPDGGVVPITFQPAQGGVVRSVLVDGVDVTRTGDSGYDAEAGTYTFTNVMADHTLAVTFVKAQSVSITDPDIKGVNGDGALHVVFTDNARFDIQGLANCPLESGCRGLSVQNTRLIVSGLQGTHRIVVGGSAGEAEAGSDASAAAAVHVAALPDSVTRPVPIRLMMAAADAHSTDASPVELRDGANVQLELAGSSVLDTSGAMNLPGIAVPVGSRLTITDAGSDLATHSAKAEPQAVPGSVGAPGPGTLTAIGAVDAAGIGACGGCDAGTVDIEGGVVSATGGDGGAGLGGAYGGAAGHVVIGGGQVTAQGGTGASGIGGGHTHSGQSVTVTGGWVRAEGGEGASGIGGGMNGSGGDVTLSGGTVYAIGGGNASGIGGGYGGAAGTIRVSGDATVAADAGPITGRPMPAIGPSMAYMGPLAPGQVGNCTVYDGGSVYVNDGSGKVPTDACAATASEAGTLGQLYPVFLPASLAGGSDVVGGALDSGRRASTITADQAAFFGGFFPADSLAGVVYAPQGDQEFTVGSETYSARVRAQAPSYADAQSDNWVLAGAIPVHLTVEGPGSIVASGETVADSGDFLVMPGASQAFSFVPGHAGAVVTGLAVDGLAVAPRAGYTMADIRTTRSIAVRFTVPVVTPPAPEQVHQVPQPNHTIEVAAGLGGVVAPSGTREVPDGGSLSVAITAAPYYRVDRVIVNGQNIGAVGSYNFDRVTSDQTLTAYFVRDVKKVKASQTTVRLLQGHKLKVVARAYMAGRGAGGMSGTAKVRWSSSKPSVAAVTATGTIKAKKVGRASLKARAGGRSVTVRVTVVAGRGAGVASVQARVPKSLKARQVAWVTGTPKPGTAVGARVTYRSSASSVASIDSAGRLTAKKSGHAVITVRAGGKAKRVRVTVK
jgi:hypothetical protein